MRFYSSVSTGFYALVVAGLLAVFLTYRSFSNLFYVNWLAGLTILGAFIIILLSGYKLNRAFFYSLVIVMAWTVWAALITPWATDILHHIKYLLVSSFYLVASCVFSYLLLSNPRSIEPAFSLIAWVWVGVNTLFLIGLYVGAYHPAKGDFSGVFHDRNVFSITTVIVLALYLAFRFPAPRVQSMLAAALVYSSCALMILVSKSITGYLGLLLVTLIFSFRFSTVVRFFILSTGLAFFAGVVATQNPISDRIERFYLAATGQTEELRESESAYVRKHLLVKGTELAVTYPLLGVGLDNARNHVKWPGLETGSFLHNTYLDILTSGGLPLFLLYYLPLFFGFFYFCFRRKKVFRRRKNNMINYWYCGFSLVSLKLLYDMTWTTYFEFAMVFSVVFSIFMIFELKTRLHFEKDSVRSEYA